MLILAYFIGVGTLVVASRLEFPNAGRVAWLGLVLATGAHAPFVVGGIPCDRRASTALLVGATVAHVALLLGLPVFSDDVWRYAVDATLTHEGIHPFAYAPSSPKLLGLADTARSLVNHPQMRTIYPPGAQAYFALLHWPDAAGIAGLRGGATLAAGIACVIAARAVYFAALLPPKRLNPGAALWSHPLVLIAVSGNGHVDALGLPLMVLWVILVTRSAIGRAAMVGAAAITVKLFPGLMLLAVVPRHRRRALMWLGVGVAVAALAWVTSLPLGTKGLGSLSTYASRWTYNGSIAPMVEACAHQALRLLWNADSIEVSVLGDWARHTGRSLVIDGHSTDAFWLNRWQVAGVVSRVVAVAATVATFAVCSRLRKGPVETLSMLIMALFLTAPVVHPWYLLWLLVPALGANHRIALLWTYTIVLAFYAPAAVIDGERWADPTGLRCLQYTPIFAGLAFNAIAARRSRPLTGSRGAP